MGWSRAEQALAPARLSFPDANETEDRNGC